MSNLKIVNSNIVHPEMFDVLVWGRDMGVNAGQKHTLGLMGVDFKIAHLSFKGGFPNYSKVIVQVGEELRYNGYTEFKNIATLDNTSEEFTYSFLEYGKYYYFRLKVISQDGVEIYTNVLELSKLDYTGHHDDTIHIGNPLN